MVESHFKDVFDRTVSMSSGGSREATLLICLQFILHKTRFPKYLLWSPYQPPMTRKGPSWEALGAVRRRVVGAELGSSRFFSPGLK